MYYITTEYINYKGGINNLQISNILTYRDNRIIKVFTSQKHQTIKRAERYLSKLIKQ